MPHGGMYNDSISRCDMYSNPYDVQLQSRQILVKYRAETYAGSKDVLESPQRRLEQELLLRIQQRNFGLAAGKFVVVVKVGMYAFMAFALPAYIFCYGLPYWLITFGFPKVLNLSKKGLKRLLRAFNALKERINPALATIQSQMKKAAELISRIKEAVQLRWNSVMQVMRKTSQRFIRPFSSAANYISGISSKFREFQKKLSGIRARIRHTLVYLPNILRKKIAAAYQKTKEGMEGVRQYLAKPFMPMVRWTRQKAATFKGAYLKAVETAQKILRRVVYRPYGKVKDAFHAMREAGNRAYQKTVDPVIQWVSLRYRSLDKLLRKQKNRVNNLKDRSKEKFREKWGSFTDRVDRALKAAVKGAVSVVQGIVQVLPSPVIAFFSIAFSPYRKLYRSRRSIIKKIKRLHEKIAKGYRKIARGVLKGLSYFGRGLEWFIPKVKAAPRKIYRVLKKAVVFFLMALKGVFFLFRLMLAWIRVIFRYGMILLREWTRSILYKVLLNTDFHGRNSL